MLIPAPIPEIRPVSDLRTHLADIERDAKELGPVVLTRNGKPSLVIIDSDSYNAEQERLRHILKLKEAEIEAKYRPEGFTLEQAKTHSQSVFEQAAAMTLVDHA